MEETLSNRAITNGYPTRNLCLKLENSCAIITMPKNLTKIHKKLSKKRGKLDSLHEYSRDAQRLRRAGGREEKLVRAAATAMKGRQIYGE